VSTSTEICEATTGSQTPGYLSMKTPRKETLRKKLAEAHTTIKELESDVNRLTVCLQQSDTIDNVLQLVEKYISPSLFIVVKNNVLNKDKNPKGRRFSNEIKQFALTIYFLGPSVFHLLQRNFCLPSIRTLRKITSKYEFQPGLNDFMFNFLSFKTKTFSSDALNCILCADEMSLKTNLFYNLSKDQIIGFNQSKSSKTYDPAKHALVLMIRGINHNWKQPLAYYLISNSCTGSDLNNIIVSTIRRLKDININVSAFVTDQGSNFVNFSKINSVTPEEPYFEVDDEKIIYIFDPPHLLKSTRNMFYKHNLIVNDEIIDKKHIDTFYNYDSKCNVRMAPKLTYSHIHPSPFEKMKVRLAAHVFSHSVAAGMSVALNQGILPKNSKYTINFINFMDRLFDIFNSSDTPNKKIYNNPFTNDGHQLDHLNKMVEMFKNMKVINKFDGSDVTKRVNFINGWLISISGLIMLWNTLNPEQKKGFALQTGRINQDCLENLFGIFRQQHGNNFNPTPIQFIWAFKKIFCLEYFKHSPNANCIEDLDSVLCKVNELNNVSPSFQKIVNPKQSKDNLFKFNPISIGTVDYRKLNIPETNALTYVCGYLMKKCLDKHICQDCINYANFQQNLEQSFLLSFFKSTSNDNSLYGKLLMPHDDFYNYIFKLESIFIEHFPSLAIEDNVGAKLKDLLVNTRLKHPCQYFNKTFLLHLFIRFRIFSSIKFLNKSLISERVRKNRKLTILKHL